jgi:hypothetical protein
LQIALVEIGQERPVYLFAPDLLGNAARLDLVKALPA